MAMLLLYVLLLTNKCQYWAIKLSKFTTNYLQLYVCVRTDRWIQTYTCVFVCEYIELQGTSGCVYTYRPS